MKRARRAERDAGAPGPAAGYGALRGRLVRNVASNYVGRFIALASWFLLTPLMLRQLGAGGYALWVLLGSVTAYGWMLDVFGGAVTKFVSEHLARDERDAAESVVSTALWIYLVLAAAVFALALATAPIAPAVFDVPPDERGLASAVVVMMGASVALAVAFMPISELMQGLHRYDLLNLTNAGGSALYAVGAAAVLVAGGGLLEMVALNIPATIGIRMVAVRVLARAPGAPRITWRRPDPAVARRIVRFGSGSFALILTDHLNTRSDEVIIGLMMPVAAVTPYSLARRLGSIADQIATQFLKVLMPIASGFHARGRADDLRKTFVASTRFTLALLVPSTFLLGGLAADLLTLWVGAEYAVHAPLVMVLCAASVLRGAAMPARSVLQGMGRQRFLAIGSIAAGLLNIALSIALLPKIGLMGVAVGTLCSAAALQMVTVPHALRVLGIPRWRIVRDAWLPSLAPALAMVFVTSAMTAIRIPGSIAWLLLTGALAGTIYIATYLAMPATSMERAAVEAMLDSPRLRRANRGGAAAGQPVARAYTSISSLAALRNDSPSDARDRAIARDI